MSITVSPGETFTWEPIETGVAGLVGTLSVGIYDGDTAVSTLTTAGVNETASSGVYEADMTAPSPTETTSYVLFASLDGTLDPDQVVTELLIVRFGFAGVEPTGDTFATVDELFRILKIRNPSPEQTTAGERVLVTAAGEINAEIDRQTDQTALAGWELSLAAEVNLRRAVELWRMQETAFGIVGLGAEFGATHIARNTWDKYAYDLAPLKRSFGLA